MRKTIFIASAVLMTAIVVLAQNVSTFTDKRDGQVYKTVEIGSQVWMAQNLNYAAKGSKCYENNADNGNKYGRLYNWETAKKACPAGYHLPDTAEWNTLVEYVGGDSTAGTKLKSKTGWDSSENAPAGTDDYGFSALPGGLGLSGGDFYNAGYYGYWWSATQDGASHAGTRRMYYGYEGVYRDDFDETSLFSVRCVRD